MKRVSKVARGDTSPLAMVQPENREDEDAPPAVMNGNGVHAAGEPLPGENNTPPDPKPDTVEEVADPPPVFDAATGRFKPKPPVVAKTDAVPRPGKTPEEVADRRMEDLTIFEYMQTLAGAGPIQIQLHRQRPKMFKGKDVAGYLGKYDELITEDDIREEHGGGTYTIQINRQNTQGKFVYFRARTVTIAGDPIPPGGIAVEADTSASRVAEARERAESKSSDRLIDMVEKQIERAEGKSSGSFEQMKIMMRPIEIQLEHAMKTIESQNERLVEQGKAPVDPYTHKMLDKLIDQDTARVAAVTAKYESEISQLKAYAREDEKRALDRHERETARLERSHADQVALIRQSAEINLAAATMAAGSQKTVLEGENRRLEREIIEMRAELKELRAKKDQSLPEKIKEIESLRGALGSDDEDEKEKSTFEKVVEIAVNSDKLIGLAGKFLGPADPATVAAAAKAKADAIAAAKPKPKPGRVMQDKKTGETFTTDAAGNRIPVRARRQVQEGETPELQIDPAQVAGATQLLELAFSNNHDPQVVATSVKSQIPEGILQAIRETSIDDFLIKVAKLPSTSPLLTQAGRNWTRKLGKALTGE